MLLTRKSKLSLIIVFILAFLVMGITYFSVNSFSGEKYKTIIEKELSNFLIYKVKIDGEITLNYPNVLAHNVQIINVLNDSEVIGTIETIKLNCGFLSWLSGTPTVSTIELKGGQLIISAFESNISKKSSHIIDINNVTLNNFILLDNLLITEGKLYTSPTAISFKGQLLGKQTKKKYATNITYNNLQSFSITLKSDIAELKTEISKSKYDLIITGKGLPFLLNDFTKISYITAADSVPFYLTAQINTSPQALSLEEINFTSDIGSLKGKWIYEDKRLDVNLQLNNLKVSNLSYKKNDLLFFSIVNQINYLITKLVKPNLDTNIMVNIINSTTEAEELNSLDLYIKNNQRQMLNVSLLGKYNTNLKFQLEALSGVDNYKSFTLGSIKINGPPSKAILDFFGIKEALKTDILELESQFYLAPQMAYLKSLKLNWNNINVIGNINLQNHGNIQSIKINANGHNINLNDFSISKNIPLLISNPKLETYLDLDLYNLTWKNKLFNKIDLSLSAAQGKVVLKDIDIKDPDINLKGQLEYQPLNMHTNLTGKIYGKYIDLSIFDTAKFLVVERNNNISNIHWNTEPINFAFLERYNGGLNIKFEKVKWSTEFLEKIDIATTFTNNIINLHKVQVKGSKKEFNATGSLGIEEDNPIKLSFSYTNFDLLPLFKENLKINAIKGRYSCVGSINSRGKSIKDFINNINGKLEIAARQIEVQGINLNTLIEKLPLVTTKRVLESLTKVDFFDGSSIFPIVDGKVNIANGLGSAALHFTTPFSNGLIASNFSLDSLRLNSIAQIFFTVPKWNNTTFSVDMNIENNIWEPKIFFDNDKIFNLIQKINATTKSDITK